MTTIVAISDTHGMHTEVSIPDGDILVHAGDLTRRGRLEDAREFDAFLGRLPHKHKIVIAGNHDFCFEEEPEKSRAAMRNCIYLQDGTATVEGIRFYGSPWQPWFYDWAFQRPRGPQMKEKWDLIPEGTGVLVTHGPPLGFGDMTARGEAAGCEDLLEAVMRIKPRLHLFGHIHEGYGRTSTGGTEFVNASVCDVAYRTVNKPAVIVL